MKEKNWVVYYQNEAGKTYTRRNCTRRFAMSRRNQDNVVSIEKVSGWNKRVINNKNHYIFE